MPEFILDTTGDVSPPNGVAVPWPHPLEWRHLSSFVQGYIEALFFTENEPGTSREERVTSRGKIRRSWEARISEGASKDIPGDYGFSDLAPETLLQIIKDCEAFQQTAKAPLERAYDLDYSEEQAGRDFWYTRNSHGVGFWIGQNCERRTRR